MLAILLSMLSKLKPKLNLPEAYLAASQCHCTSLFKGISCKNQYFGLNLTQFMLKFHIELIFLLTESLAISNLVHNFRKSTCTRGGRCTLCCACRNQYTKQLLWALLYKMPNLKWNFLGYKATEFFSDCFSQKIKPAVLFF